MVARTPVQWALRARSPLRSPFLSQDRTDLGVFARAHGTGEKQDQNYVFFLSSRLVYLHMGKVFLSTSSSSPKCLRNGLPFENEPFLDHHGVCSAPCLWKKQSGSLVSGLHFIFLNVPPSLWNFDLFYLQVQKVSPATCLRTLRYSTRFRKISHHREVAGVPMWTHRTTCQQLLLIQLMCYKWPLTWRPDVMENPASLGSSGVGAELCVITTIDSI